jgi:hypothetical protein
LEIAIYLIDVWPNSVKYSQFVLIKLAEDLKKNLLCTEGVADIFSFIHEILIDVDDNDLPE